MEKKRKLEKKAEKNKEGKRKRVWFTFCLKHL
jgi:hypothetical protein